MLRVAAGHRMVFQFTEVAGKSHMLAPRDVLVAKEKHFVLQQQGLDLAGQAEVARRFAQVHARYFRTDGARQLFDFHCLLLRR